MKSGAGALLGLVLGLGLGGCGLYSGPPVLPLGGDFTLTDHEGRPFQSSSLHGSALLVFFGYTYCPEACPITLSKLSAVCARLGADRERVKTLYITVDPDRDRPEVIRDHLAAFAVDAVGLTGTMDEISRVARQFGATHAIEAVDSRAGYQVSHSTTLYLVDPEGRTRLLFPYEAAVDDIVAGVRSVL